MFQDQVAGDAVAPVQPDLTKLESIETIGELLWLIENSSVLNHSLFSFASKFLFENNDLILKNLKEPSLKVPKPKKKR